MKKWSELPQNMQNDAVKKYYDILKTKTASLILKRVFDILVSSVLIVIVSPIMLILAICIKIDSKGPVMFRQRRVTTNGKVFRIFKFRTMVNDAEKKGTQVTTNNDPRVTKVGKLIRGCRLDELPQLFNVFLGQMSFVGTRPEVRRYVDMYTPEMMATLLLPAGITSKASLAFKDEDEKMTKLTQKGYSVDEAYVNHILPEKMKMNLDYIEKFSFMEDISTCIKTVL